MKNYDERIESIFRKYDEKIEAKRRKNAVIRRIAFSTSGLCAAVIVAVLAIKIPNRTDFNPPDVVEPSTNSVEVTTTTDLPQTTGQANTTFTTSFANSETKTTETMTNVTTVSNKTELTTSNNTLTTTTKHISPVTTVLNTTKTTTQVKTTTLNTTETTPPSGADVDNIVYMENKYRITGRSFTDAELKELPNSQMPVPINVSQGQSLQLKLYEIGGLSTDYAVAALIDGQPLYTLCLGDYTPGTMQSLFSDTALNIYWSIDKIYENRNEINDIDANTQARVFDVLLNLPDMENSKGVSLGNTLMKIELKSDVLGECTIELTEKGFLSTNIGGYFSSYLIGCDEIDMIIKSIKNEIM